MTPDRAGVDNAGWASSRKRRKGRALSVFSWRAAASKWLDTGPQGTVTAMSLSSITTIREPPDCTPGARTTTFGLLWKGRFVFQLFNYRRNRSGKAWYQQQLCCVRLSHFVERWVFPPLPKGGSLCSPRCALAWEVLRNATHTGAVPWRPDAPAAGRIYAAQRVVQKSFSSEPRPSHFCRPAHSQVRPRRWRHHGFTARSPRPTPTVSPTWH